jgi:flagellar hook-associated protein 3 FlgL
MRVSDQTRVRMMLDHIQTHTTDLNELYVKMASQRQVQKPSDDAIATAAIMRLGDQLRSLEQNQQSIAAAQAFCDAAGSALESGVESITRLQTLAVRAAGSVTLSAADRAAMGNEAEQIIETLLNLANESSDGRFLFAGTRTDERPVAALRDDAGHILSVTYAGADDPARFPIGRGQSVTLSATARSAFIDTGLLDAAIALRDHLRNDAALPTAAQDALLSADLDRINRARAGYLEETGRAAARSAMLDLLDQQTQSGITRVNEMLSRVRDVDMAQIAVNLQQEQTNYQALLASTARIMGTNLMSYL